MQSKAATVAEYLSELPPDRRAALEAVRTVISANLDPDIEEGMSYGMIGYYIPHRVYAPGYHCDPKLPLPYAGLASQKNHMSIYLSFVYDACGPGTAQGTNDFSEWFREQWKATGLKLDMGKCCIRFRRIDQVPLALIGEAIRRVSAKDFIAQYEASRGAQAQAKASRSSAGKPEAKPRSSAK